jgi:hypothetical protein
MAIVDQVVARANEWMSNPLFRVAMLARITKWDWRTRKLEVSDPVSSIYQIESIDIAQDDVVCVFVNDVRAVQYLMPFAQFLALKVENSMVDLMPEFAGIDAMVDKAKEQVRGYIAYHFNHFKSDLKNEFYTYRMRRLAALHTAVRGDCPKIDIAFDPKGLISTNDIVASGDVIRGDLFDKAMLAALTHVHDDPKTKARNTRPPL